MHDNINRLLVVDSGPRNCREIQDAATGIGFAVASADGLPQFLALFDEFSPSVVVMNMDLPGADGVEALRALSERGCEAEIILMGNTDRRVMSTAMKLGASRGLSMAGMLVLPYEKHELTTCLAQVFMPDRRLGAGDIAGGLERGEFIAFYQPKAELVESTAWRIAQVEALVRWQHPQLGLVMPDEFIPEAEKSGLIGQLTFDVLTQAVAQIGRWEKAGIALSCSVNLPPVLVTDLDLPDRIAEILRAGDVSPSRVSLELTETATMQDPTTTMDILTRLRVKGLGLSIDDFGTGYSSITRLYQMPFDEMKIDKSLVMNIPRSREANTIVSSLIELGHNLGLSICAEGVENRAALDLLAQLGCDRCQGFYISRAIPGNDIPSFVAKWNAHDLERTGVSRSPVVRAAS